MSNASHPSSLTRFSRTSWALQKNISVVAINEDVPLSYESRNDSLSTYTHHQTSDDIALTYTLATARIKLGSESSPSTGCSRQSLGVDVGSFDQ